MKYVKKLPFLLLLLLLFSNCIQNKDFNYELSIIADQANTVHYAVLDKGEEIEGYEISNCADHEYSPKVSFHSRKGELNAKINIVAEREPFRLFFRITDLNTGNVVVESFHSDSLIYSGVNIQASWDMKTGELIQVTSDKGDLRLSQLPQTENDSPHSKNPFLRILLTWGYLGLFIGTFLAATVLPFSSEILVTGLLYAGANSLYIFLVATLGNWLGSISTYYLGWLGKWEWIERLFKVTPEKLEKQQAKISKYGSILAFFVWFPVVGDVFALALGFYKVSPRKCILFMLIGKMCRFALYILFYNYVSGWLGIGLKM